MLPLLIIILIEYVAGGPEGLRSLTSTKAIVVDRWPWLVQTSIPKQLDYPIRSVEVSWYVCLGILTTVITNHPQAIRERAHRILLCGGLAQTVRIACGSHSCSEARMRYVKRIVTTSS